MEHLDLAKGGKLTEHDVVPYVACEDYKHTSYTEWLDKQWPWISSEWVSNTGRDKIPCMLQTWFFFGLHKQLLGSFFVPENYIVPRSGADGRMELDLCTSGLERAMQDWSQSADNLDATKFSPVYEKCFWPLLDDMGTARMLLDSRECPRSISISILSTAKLLHFYILHAFPFKIRSLEFWPRFDYMPETDLQTMCKNGWCPFEATRAWSQVCLPVQMMARTSASLSTKDEDHSACDTARCAYSQIDPASFSQSHAEPDCDCQSFTVDREELDRMVESDMLPLIPVKVAVDERGRLSAGWPGKEKGQITLRPFVSTESTPYITISHVWADGLGNPFENSLPHCQLERLFFKAAMLLITKWDKSSLGVNSIDALNKLNSPEPSVYIWLDTLCCPARQSTLKSKVISDLPNIYRDSTGVLVLDKGLEGTEMEPLGTLEMAMRVCTSRWTRRAWTLQEGIMAPKLWICVADGVLFMDALIEEVDQVHQQQVGSRQAAQNLAQLLSQINGGSSKQTPGSQLRWDLSQLLDTISLRSLSFQSDEPLCLRLIMSGFDEKMEAETLSFEDNMSRFWDYCRKKTLVKRHIIFGPLPRLAKKGYRWAPRSLLFDNHGVVSHRARMGLWPQSRSDASFNIADLPKTPLSQDEVDSRGLPVVFAGFVLSTPPEFPFGEQLAMFKEGKEGDVLLGLLLHHPVGENSGQWYRFEKGAEPEGLDRQMFPDDEKKLCFIMSDLTQVEGAGVHWGLFASVMEEGEGFHHVNVRGRAKMLPVDQSVEHLLNALLAGPVEDESLVTPKMLGLAHSALWRTDHSLSGPEQENEMVRDYIVRLSARLREGSFLTVERTFHKNHMWIVD